ncbi:MAG TPA: M1 family metallopeptidase [Gammaproteobacteria bacterium]|jgi:hypothetical protein
MSLPRLSLAAACAACSLSTFAAATAPDFEPRESFAPFVYPTPASSYRSAAGVPGPDYWQNRADYRIQAKLDPASDTLTGEETITYTNHSPDALPVLWLQLDQNRYRTDARGAFADEAFPKEFTEGYKIESVDVLEGKLFQHAAWTVVDTRMQVTLPESLGPKDGRAQLRIRWHYTVPGPFGGRNDVDHSKNGDIFEIAQWYPRMCVYDDVRGWDTAPFLAQEFYLEYGDIDYSVTVPWDMIVVGSGELMNPKDVLTATELKRLEQARHSDATVMIRSPEEVTDPSTRPVQTGDLTWHFQMKQTRDVAFGASKAYVWDAARIKLPQGKTALAMSAYPVESAGDQAWGRATEYLKASVEYFSKQWLPYTYPVAINEAGSAGGMEYPGLTFDAKEGRGSDLHALIAHEIGHNWFPMVVGSDERRDAFMDEGFNTFIDVYEADAFNHGEYAPKRDNEYAPGKADPADQLVPIIADPDAPPPLTQGDLILEKYRHPITYFKSAYGLVLLREVILGPARFDASFRRYIAAWAFKHPKPSDFFRFMDSDAGEDLSWFWRGWFQHNWPLDQAVTDVKPLDGDWTHGAAVTLANYRKLVMPTTLEVAYVDGSKQDVAIPVETWFLHKSWTIDVQGDKRVTSVTLDPRHLLPDMDRSNDSYTVPTTPPAP